MWIMGCNGRVHPKETSEMVFSFVPIKDPYGTIMLQEIF